MKCARCGFPVQSDTSMTLTMCEGQKFLLCFDCAGDLAEMILKALVKLYEQTPKDEAIIRGTLM